MNTLLILSSVLTLASCSLVAVSVTAHIQNRKLLTRLRARQIVANSHLQKSRMDLMEVRNRAKLLEDTVKHGTSAVEKMHKAISTTTFSLIDHFAKDDEFRENARRARETHDSTSRQIYDAARTTNKALHLLADSLFITRKEQKLTTRSKPKDKQ